MHVEHAVAVAQDPAVVHRHDQHVAIRQPAQARDGTIVFGHNLPPGAFRIAQHAVGVHVGKVERAVVPAWRFAEGQVVGQQRQGMGHGGSLAEEGLCLDQKFIFAPTP
jgi:hypothetical protein